MTFDGCHTWQAKLIMLAWLLFKDGADDVYRIIRNFILRTVVGGKLLRDRQREADLQELQVLRESCQELVDAALRTREEEKREKRTASRRKSHALTRVMAGIPHANAAAIPAAPPAEDYDEEFEEEGSQASDEQVCPRHALYPVPRYRTSRFALFTTLLHSPGPSPHHPPLT